MLDALAWLIAIEIIGLIFTLVAFLLFSRLPDRGFAFAKVLGLLLVSYILWLLGLTQLVPNSRLTIVAIVLAAGVVSAWLAWRRRHEIRQFLSRHWPAMVAAEVVFLVFFGFWLGIVSDAPAINHTEKPMDFAFLNAVLQSPSFPPEDPWLAGHPISYYYFGHFNVATLTNLTAVPSAVGYNLGVALVPALLAMGAFGLVYNLVRLSGGSGRAGIGFGVIAPVLLILIGNLEGGLELAYSQGWGSDGFWQWVGVKGLEAPATAGGGAFPGQTWWWWRATRVIDTLNNGQSLDYTITEFPFFSFILGDLHPHVVSLPFLIMFLGVALNIFQTRRTLGLAWLLRHPVESAMVALLLGSLAFINAWDFPVFAAVLALVILAKTYGQTGQAFFDSRGSPLSSAATAAVAMMLPIAILAVVLFLPFYRDLSSQASGILPVTGPGTRPFLFFLVMGFFTLLALTFLVKQLPGLRRPDSQDVPALLLIAGVSVVPLALWLVSAPVAATLTGSLDQLWATIPNRLLLIVPGLAIAGLAAFSALQRARYSSRATTAFPLLLLAVSFYLLVGAELFFLVDFFGNRMNTVFKVYFQSWMLLAIVGAYGLYYWRTHWQPRASGAKAVQFAWAGVIAALFIVSLYYPVGAAVSRTGISDESYQFSHRTLDGLAFVQRNDPDEYAAIQWLSNSAVRGRIVEAVGDDYSDHGRISSSTGLPTILGWPGHEHQWRGTTRVLDGRAENVETIYTSDNPDEVLALLDQYDVRYVYVGRRERVAYGTSGLTDFAAFMRTAFESGGVVIYERINGTSTGSAPGF